MKINSDSQNSFEGIEKQEVAHVVWQPKQNY